MAMAFSCVVLNNRKAFEADDAMEHTLLLKIGFDLAG
jgi:hypothetical protein